MDTDLRKPMEELSLICKGIGWEKIFISIRFTSTTRSFCTVQILVEEKVASFVVLSHCVTHKLCSEELFGEKYRFWPFL